MAGEDVIVVPTGSANIASVFAAIGRAGRTAVLSRDPAVIAGATYVVLPGVGAFGAAMASLGEAGLVDVLRGRMAENRSTLCICLGMQVLFETSEESDGVPGLGVVSGGITKLRGHLRRRVPSMGWAAVRAAG